MKSHKIEITSALKYLNHQVRTDHLDHHLSARCETLHDLSSFRSDHNVTLILNHTITHHPAHLSLQGAEGLSNGAWVTIISQRVLIAIYTFRARLKTQSPPTKTGIRPFPPADYARTHFIISAYCTIPLCSISLLLAT